MFGFGLTKLLVLIVIIGGALMLYATRAPSLRGGGLFALLALTTGAVRMKDLRAAVSRRA